MKKLLLLVAALLCLTCPAMAEDVCTIEAADTARCTTDRSYIRIVLPLEGEQYVTVTIRDDWGYLVYQRDHGLCSGVFRSEDVYLGLYGSSSVYTVTIQTDDVEHVLQVTREQPRLTDTGVCSAGLPLEVLTGNRAHRNALILDVCAGEEGPLTVPMVSEGMQLGQLCFLVENGELTVSADLTASGDILKASVYVARDAVTARTLGTSRFTDRRQKLDQPIDLYGTPYAAVLVQLTVAYDEATVLPAAEDEAFLEQQTEWWNMMQILTANEAVG